ncbi:MAG: VWA domain-containing protein [Candidatus Woesearchaeota archaeon]
MEINLNFLGLDYLVINNVELYQLGLIFLLIYIIIYLVKPKSVKKVIPSLMFLILNKKKGKLNSFLRRLLIDPLFLLQFLILLLLIFSLFMPQISYEYDLSDENTIFVIDVSASMNAKNRFSEMKEIVKENAKGSISAVLIKKNSHIYFENELPEKAIELINILEPSVSSSNIVEAIKIADDLMANKTGRIIVISDFKDNFNSYDDLLDLKNFLIAKERIIEYHVLEPKENNVGFIDFQYLNNEIILHIKNFNNKKTDVSIEIYDEIKYLELLPNSIEFVKFVPRPKKSVIKILEDDDFNLDNNFYLYYPDETKLDVLLITNNDRTFLHDFLRSSPNINLDINTPPSIPNINYDVIIFDNVRREFMLTRIKDELVNYVTNGGSLIVTRTGDIDSFDFDEFLPVEMINQIIPNMGTNSYEEFTKDLYFGTITNFRNANLKNGSAKILDGQHSVLIAYSNFGKGKVLYYAIPEHNNNFHFTTSYPLFWNRVLKFITNFNNFEYLNLRSIDSDYDKNLGFIEKGNNIVALNLLNRIESDVTADVDIMNFIEETQVERKSMFVKKYFNLNYIIIPLILLILFLELLFIKYRGDL